MKIKALVCLLISLITFCIVNSAQFPDGTEYEPIIKVYPNTAIYNTNNDTFMMNISSENPLKHKRLDFYGIGFPKDKGSGFHFNFSFEGNNADLIEWRYAGTGYFATGGWARPVYPHLIMNLYFNFNKYWDLSKVGSSVITCKGKYGMILSDFDEHGFEIQGPQIHFSLNPFRLFVNMDNELIKVKMKIEPEKWNLNWFDMAKNKGVFTVWLKEKDFPNGYKIEDIKQDTILFNGVLSPTSFKILGSGENKFLMLKFSKRDGISYIGEIKKGDKIKINISGQFKNQKWFISEKEIEITGKSKYNRYRYIKYIEPIPKSSDVTWYFYGYKGKKYREEPNGKIYIADDKDSD